MKAVVLIGFMGAGKSSVGRMVSEKLGWAFEDLDARIEQLEERTVAEIFRDSGEERFRRAEYRALKQVLGEIEAGAGKIVALGGGTFVQSQNAELMETADVATLFLDASVEELWRRCKEQAKREQIERPLVRDLASFRELYQIRRPHYLKASIRQETSGKTVEEIAREIIQTLGFEPVGETRGEK